MPLGEPHVRNLKPEERPSPRFDVPANSGFVIINEAHDFRTWDSRPRLTSQRNPRGRMQGLLGPSTASQVKWGSNIREAGNQPYVTGGHHQGEPPGDKL